MRRNLVRLSIPAALVAVLVLSLGMQDPPKKKVVAMTSGGAVGERQAVERAVLDYCEAFYDVKPEYVERSIHPQVTKLGFYRKSAADEYRQAPMNYEQLLSLSKVWNKEGRVGADAPKEVVVLDMLDQIAVAKLTAVWVIDYIHLAKYDGKWKIIQVIWQSHPAEKK